MVTPALSTPLASDGTNTVSGSSTTVSVVITKLRTICISGFAETTRDMANKVGPEVEIWSLNRCYSYLKRWNRWYEVHQPELYTGKTGLREAGYIELLRKSNVPIYMQVPDPSVPQAVLFPKAEILEAGFRDYFTTSIAYMLAHAAYEHKVLGQKIGQILMYGIDMAAYSEYSYQRPCVEYWCGVLDGLGIENNGKLMLSVPRQSPTLKGPGYGDHHYKYLWEQANDLIMGAKSKQAQQAANFQAIIGAISEYNEIPKPDVLEGLDLAAISKDDLVTELKKRITANNERIKKRRQILGEAQAGDSANLNSSIGQLVAHQHWLTILGAPQTKEQEPDTPKMPNI